MHQLFLELFQYSPVIPRISYSKFPIQSTVYTHILFCNIKQQTKYVAIVLGITFTVRVLRDPHHTLMF